MRARVQRLSMAHPGDVSALEQLIQDGTVDPRDIAAVIGKTEGNGGVNDFTRGYFTQSLMLLLARYTARPAQDLQRAIPCVLSGGTEGVLSPHYVVFCRSQAEESMEHPEHRPAHGSLAIGIALSDPVAAEDVGRRAHVESVAAAVRRAIEDARLASAADVHFVQVKCPCVTSTRAQDALRRGRTPLTGDANRSMAYARAAGAFGVALALGEIDASAFDEAALLRDFHLYSSCASISSGVEIDCNEVVVLGNSAQWTGDLRIAHRTMADALDIGAVAIVLADLDIATHPQVSASDGARIAATLVKCEPDRRGRVRGQRHTMLDDTDINAQRHIRGALGGLVAGVLGDTRIFVSGGAEHQGPDGGGLIAVIAAKR
jgi:cyanuric acid amidohydrolase